MAAESSNAENDDRAENAEDEARREEGPLRRLGTFAAQRFATLRPKDEDDVAEPADDSDDPSAGAARFSVPSDSEQPPAPTIYRRRVQEYRERQRRRREETGGGAPPGSRENGGGEEGDASGEDEGDASPASGRAVSGRVPEPPQPPPANNWVPIGPSVIRQGQVVNQTATSGRIAGLAVAPGATRIYAAGANAGVWRSDDRGENWRPMMNAWDLNPTVPASDSLACGAVAIDPADPDRIYVGSGEGATVFIRAGAVVAPLAFLGVGPIRSDDGGDSWNTEPATPSLDGQAFYRLAVDPGDRERVVGATTNGLYRREPAGGGFSWNRTRTGVFTSVVAARSAGTTTFYAARWGGGVVRSNDGNTWTDVGAGFPTASVGRISLAALSVNPDVVYALIADSATMGILGVWRLDGGTGAGTWRQVTGHPADLFDGQGWYDQAIAIDPNDDERLYLGGSTRPAPGVQVGDPDRWSSSLYRCVVSSSGTGAGLTHSMANTYIGSTVHADVHALTFTPGDSNKLWVGCDGGVFFSAAAGGTASFTARNTGLATITMEHLSQHPTEDAVVFAGTQDNGTVRFTGEECWLHMAPGDGGFSVVDWDDPYRLIVTYPYDFAGGRCILRRFTDGGTRDSYTDIVVDTPGDSALFYYPLVGTPRNPGSPAQAGRIAIGTSRPLISDDFGTAWQSIPNGNTTDRLGSGSVFAIKSMIFAAFNKLYVGTMNGRVYRCDETAAGWTVARIDNAGGANSLPNNFALPVTDIAVDPADGSGASIYITFGGSGDYRHVWHFDGAQWQQRSGPTAGDPSSLLDVQHSAIAVDPANASHIYVGADIGCWHSSDGGANWMPFSEGLPDASVVDLKLHAETRLLRVSTHGRSVFERRLQPGLVAGVELYVRDTQLDQGRRPTVNGSDDPTAQGESVWHWRGPDIKLDTPDAGGNFQFPVTGTIDFYEFVDKLSDDSRNVATHATETITTRVYVQVHNRGVTRADDVRVMLLLSNASAGLPALPAGYETDVQNGTPINNASWRTVGIESVDDVRAGFPKIASFNLDSSMLPPPANLAGNDHHCVLALVHHSADRYTATETNTDLNSLQERKAAHKNLKVVQFAGTLPAPPALVVPIRLNSSVLDERVLVGLDLQLHGYGGRVRLVLPSLVTDGDVQDLIVGAAVEEDLRVFDAWAEEQTETIRQNQNGNNPYNRVWAQQHLRDIDEATRSRTGLRVDSRDGCAVRRIVLEAGSYTTVYLVLDRPDGGSVGDAFPLELLQTDGEGGQVRGGMDIRVELVPEAEDRPGEGDRPGDGDEEKKEGDGICVIATTLYGETSWQVHRLRGFRDSRLASNAPGRAAIRLYYRLGPYAARVLSRSSLLTRIARSVIDLALRPGRR